MMFADCEGCCHLEVTEDGNKCDWYGMDCDRVHECTYLEEKGED